MPCSGSSCFAATPDEKYRCACGAGPGTLAGPPSLPGGGRHALDFAIEVEVSKWSDHAPLQQQVRIMRREGLDVDSSTLWEQAERIARVLGPTYEAMRGHVVAGDVVHGDETPWYMLKASAVPLSQVSELPGSESRSRVF